MVTRSREVFIAYSPEKKRMTRLACNLKCSADREGFVPFISAPLGLLPRKRKNQPHTSLGLVRVPFACALGICKDAPWRIFAIHTALHPFGFFGLSTKRPSVLPYNPEL